MSPEIFRIVLLLAAAEVGIKPFVSTNKEGESEEHHFIPVGKPINLPLLKRFGQIRGIEGEM